MQKGNEPMKKLEASRGVLQDPAARVCVLQFLSCFCRQTAFAAVSARAPGCPITCCLLNSTSHTDSPFSYIITFSISTGPFLLAYKHSAMLHSLEIKIRLILPALLSVRSFIAKFLKKSYLLFLVPIPLLCWGCLFYSIEANHLEPIPLKPLL